MSKFKPGDYVVYHSRLSQPRHLLPVWFGRIFRVVRVRANGLHVQDVKTKEYMDIAGLDKFALVDDYEPV